MSSTGISDNIETISVRTANIAEDVGELKKGFGRLDYAIRGNGTPGISTRLDRLERQMGGLVTIIKWLVTFVAGIVSAMIVKLLISP